MMNTNETTRYRLKDILVIVNGKDHSSLDDGEYPVLGSGGIMRYANSYLYDGESVLLPRKGTLNNIQFIKGKFWTVDTCYYTKINNAIVNPYYLYRYLRSLDLSGLDSGASIPSMTSKCYYGIKIRIPDICIQQKIANILSRYDEAIENNNKRIKLLEQMAQNLYKEWFVRFRFPGYKKCEFENGIPKGWKVEKLENFGIVLESGSRPSGGVDINLEEGIPSLGAECIKGFAEFDYSNIKYIPLEFYEKMKRGKNKGNHILLYKDGAYIGKVTLFRNQFPFKKYAINEHVFFLNSKNDNYLNWLFFTLRQDSYFNLMQNLNRNAAQPGLSQPDINRIKIRIPSEDVVIKFNEFVEPIFNIVFDLAKANKNLSKQRDLLLPRLMSGKLEA